MTYMTLWPFSVSPFRDVTRVGHQKSQLVRDTRRRTSFSLYLSSVMEMTDGGKSRLDKNKSTPQEKKNIPLTGGAKAGKLSVASLSKTLARTGKHHHSCVTHEYIDEAKYSGKLQYVSYSNGFKKNIFFKRTIVRFLV